MRAPRTFQLTWRTSTPLPRGYGYSAACHHQFRPRLTARTRWAHPRRTCTPILVLVPLTTLTHSLPHRHVLLHARTEGLDWSVSHAKVGDTSGDGHVVVLPNGHFWRLDAAQDGHILRTAELEA